MNNLGKKRKNKNLAKKESKKKGKAFSTSNIEQISNPRKQPDDLSKDIQEPVMKQRNGGKE